MYQKKTNLIECMGDMALMPKSTFLEILKVFWDLWSLNMTTYPTPYALWMIILSLGHTIMYVPMRNLIQCMGDMALMPKYVKINIFLWFFIIFGIFGARIWPHMLLQTPYEWLFYLWDTIVYVTIRNDILCKGYMAFMSKICLKWLILGDFGDFWDLLSPFTTQYFTLWSPKCFGVVSIETDAKWYATSCVCQ